MSLSFLHDCFPEIKDHGNFIPEQILERLTNLEKKEEENTKMFAMLLNVCEQQTKIIEELKNKSSLSMNLIQRIIWKTCDSKDFSFPSAILHELWSIDRDLLIKIYSKHNFTTIDINLTKMFFIDLFENDLEYFIIHSAKIWFLENGKKAELSVGKLIILSRFQKQIIESKKYGQTPSNFSFLNLQHEDRNILKEIYDNKDKVMKRFKKMFNKIKLYTSKVPYNDKYYLLSPTNPECNEFIQEMNKINEKELSTSH
jgi:hypothetical protein